MTSNFRVYVGPETDEDVMQYAETRLQAALAWPRRTLFAALLQRVRRRDWTANPADPTAVTSYRYTSRHVRVTLTASWGVESHVEVFGHRLWAYDHKLATWFYEGLEEAYAIREAERDEPEW